MQCRLRPIALSAPRRLITLAAAVVLAVPA